ncbi:MAG: hypothetical protein P8184_04020 [Calditrichia bacterium]
MENPRNGSSRQSWEWRDWSKEESEELVLIYLEDYYRTLDEYFLKEALQISKDEGVDIQKIMRLAKTRMN